MIALPRLKNLSTLLVLGGALLAACGSTSGADSRLESGASGLTLASTTDDTVQGTGLNQFEYAGNWFNCAGCEPQGTYQQGHHYAYDTGAKVTFRFSGTQVRLYGTREPVGGIASITLDGQAQPDVDTYAATKAPALLYTSPVLASGTHTLVYAVAGRHSSASSSNTITLDKAEVYTGSSTPPPVLLATADDTDVGTAANQFDYAGNWFDCGGCNPTSTYKSGHHYAYDTGAKVTLRFNGTQAKLYGVKEPVGGIASITLDGQAQPDVDTYAATQSAALIYTSPVLASGSHTLVVSVAGRHNASSGSNTISVDKLEVYGNGTTGSSSGGSTGGTTGGSTGGTTGSTGTTGKVGPLYIVSGPLFSSYSDLPREDGMATWLANNNGWAGIANGDWLPSNSDFTSFPNKTTAWFDLALPLTLEGDDANADLDAIASGAHDADYASGVAKWKSFGVNKVIVRVEWEMDGGGRDPAKFRAAWNHIVPVLRRAAAANGVQMKIAWAPIHESSTEYLPDIANVDLLTPDLYLDCWSQTNVTASQVIACVNQEFQGLEQLGAQYHRPIGLGETAAVRQDKPEGNWDSRGAGDSYDVFNQTVGALVRRNAGTDHYVFNVNYYNLQPGGVEIDLGTQPNTRRALHDLMLETRAW